MLDRNLIDALSIAGPPDHRDGEITYPIVYLESGFGFGLNLVRLDKDQIYGTGERKLIILMEGMANLHIEGRQSTIRTRLHSKSRSYTVVANRRHIIEVEEGPVWLYVYTFP